MKSNIKLKYEFKEIYLWWISIHNSHRFLRQDWFALLIVKRLSTARPAKGAHHWCLQSDRWLMVGQSYAGAQGERNHAVSLEGQGRGWGYLVYLLDSSLIQLEELNGCFQRFLLL